jgi:hypothetical protein
MAYQGISTGTIPNDGTGDTLLNAALKINSNFKEIYQSLGNGTNLTNTINNTTLIGVTTTSSVVVGIGTSQGVVLTSQNGIKYRIFVNNDGTLSTVAV